jgi:hypothetical protein
MSCWICPTLKGEISSTKLSHLTTRADHPLKSVGMPSPFTCTSVPQCRSVHGIGGVRRPRSAHCAVRPRLLPGKHAASDNCPRPLCRPAPPHATN